MKFFSILLLTLSFQFTFVEPARAQATLGPDGPSNPKRGATGYLEPLVHQLTVTPAAAPKLPLTYSIYPRANELRPGNSAPMWHRTLRFLDNEVQIAKVYRATRRPLKSSKKSEFPTDEARRFVVGNERTYASARLAAYRRDTLWDLQMGELRGKETIEVMLGEFQDGRELARLLLLKTNLLIHDGNFEAAMDEMKVTLRLARDVAEPESYINDLIGIAIHSMTFDSVEMLIDQPGSPNMYWAIAQLPQPFIDIRPSREFEITLHERYFPWMVDPEAEERTTEQWRDLIYETVRHAAISFDFFPDKRVTEKTPKAEVELLVQQYVLQNYSAAKQLLIEHGRSPEDVEAMPVGKVLALREVLLYRMVSQEYAANTLLPFTVSQARYASIQSKVQQYGQPSIVGVFLPSIQNVYMAQVRMQSKEALFMTIEAIRMHLAESGGQLPKSLDEITVIPVPDFAFTGKPFVYELQGDTAIIDAPLPAWPLRYEIRVDQSAVN